MISSVLLSILVAPALVLAQYGYAPPVGNGGATTTAAASAPSAPPDTPGNMNINVAFNGNFVFNPANITAPVGTLVTFWFPAGPVPHSVTQSSFAQPCTYLTANSSAGTPAGFDSGLTNAVQFTINVTDDQPIWFHCKQVLHCGMGMVGSINAPTNGSNTFDQFQAAALQIGSNEATETSGGPVTGGVNGVALATPAATGSGSTGTTSSTSSSTKIVASFGLSLLATVMVLSLA